MYYDYANFVRRDEFERRLTEMGDRVNKVESSVEKKIDQITTKLDGMQQLLERNSTGRWQWVAGIAVSFIFGSGGLYGILTLSHALK